MGWEHFVIMALIAFGFYLLGTRYPQFAGMIGL